MIHKVNLLVFLLLLIFFPFCCCCCCWWWYTNIWQCEIQSTTSRQQICSHEKIDIFLFFSLENSLRHIGVCVRYTLMYIYYISPACLISLSIFYILLKCASHIYTNAQWRTFFDWYAREKLYVNMCLNI